MTKNNKGFTVIEVVIALAIIMILSVPIYNLTINSTKITNNIVHSNTMFENARKSIDFITNAIAYANVIEIETYAGTGSAITKYSQTTNESFYGKLHSLKLIEINGSKKDVRVFRYTDVRGSDNSYNRLDFGGGDFDIYTVQELATNIKNMYVSVNNETDIMTLTITMEGDESPLVLTKQISLRHKTKYNDSILN